VPEGVPPRPRLYDDLGLRRARRLHLRGRKKHSACEVGMRFLIDATGWTNRRGYGRFIRNAVGRLVESDADARYVLLVDRATAQPPRPGEAEIVVVETRKAPVTAAAEGSARGIADLVRFTRASRRIRPDALLFPSLQTWFPSPGIANVVGVHDTIPDELPELA